MRRVLAIAATLVLAAPALAIAQAPPGGGGGGGHKPARAAAPQHVAPRGPVGGNGPAFRHGPIGNNGPAFHRGPIGHGPVVGGPVHGPVRVGVGGGPFVFHGHEIHRMHFARPWAYPPGWGYRRWAIGAVLPALFLAPAYHYSGWADVGLTPPPPGFQWIQYGPDLLLVNVATGEVIDTAYGVFY